MKSLPLVSIALLLTLCGCSKEDNQISEIEKRNKFEACVLDFMADPKNKSATTYKSDREKFRQDGEIACRNLLK